jgi:hypothetical protein
MAVMKRIVILLCLFLLVLAAVPASVLGQSIGATSGEISVYNESGFDVFISISDHDRGKIEAGYSKTYRVPLGEHRVVATTDPKFDKEAHADFVISGTYPTDSWYIHNDDLN